MFPKRFFAGRYFADNYYPPVSGIIIVTGDNRFILLLGVG